MGGGGTELLIDALPGEVRAAWLRAGRADDLAVLRTHRPALAGNVYLGRVVRVEPALNGAFVDIGEGEAAFLSAAEAAARAPEGERGAHISALVHEGEAVVVQVTREAAGGKGPRATRRIILTGLYLIYAPFEAGVRLSRRIGEAAERHRLAEALAGLARPGEGLVVRTAAAGASAEALVAEAERLRAAWAEIGARATTLAARGEAPALLVREPGPVPALLRDRAAGVERVVIEGPSALAEARAFAADCSPALADRIEPWRGRRPLFAAFGIEEEIEAALARELRLASGARLFIDETRALVAVDVDTSRAKGPIAAVNLEALAEAARQMRLRNLSGQIMIDVIDRGVKRERERLLEAFRAAVADDPAEVFVLGFSRLGLIECTRRRRRPPLAEVMLEPTAEGGLRKTGATLAFEAVRAALAGGADHPGKAPAILADERALAALAPGGEAAGALAFLAERSARPVALRTAAAPPSQGFEIVFE
ncbi:MAG: ribonuclease E/G [Proteobacteria bacterium]|nr:ribonuclease E/G [Pseudomonadota bacterium]